ncbi:MAG TPA: right-handed parallel beta-helix repeat-containing protein, partial [Candidatus Nitrosocosmicus sp.]|nr:right-handed parallel beta-helix repeat-containing protein [Candidatus Nitrosocosmicus sp.]
TLRNLKMGHTITLNEYDCNAGVLHINGSTNISISNCIFYGCGSMGITSYNSSSLKMDNSVIEKCNLRIMSLYESEDFTFTNCKFRETRHLDMFNLFYAKNITFDNCEIRDNTSDYGSLFELSSSANIKVMNTKMINNKADSVGNGLILTGITFQGNSFDK